MICSVSSVWFYRLNYCLCLLLPPSCRCGYPPNTGRSSRTTQTAEFLKMGMSFILSKKQSRWLVRAPRSAFSTFRMIVWSCLQHVQTHKAMNNKRLDSECSPVHTVQRFASTSEITISPKGEQNDIWFTGRDLSENRYGVISDHWQTTDQHP